jgi:hypothetical protein
MTDTRPSFEQAFAIAAALAGVVAQTGDTGLIQMTGNVSARTSRFTLDSDPDDVRAVIDMLETCEFHMGRLAKIAAEPTDA